MWPLKQALAIHVAGDLKRNLGLYWISFLAGTREEKECLGNEV